jgi:hypothetical protein
MNTVEIQLVVFVPIFGMPLGCYQSRTDQENDTGTASNGDTYGDADSDGDGDSDADSNGDTAGEWQEVSYKDFCRYISDYNNSCQDCLQTWSGGGGK